MTQAQQIGYRQSLGVANNQRAMAQRQTAGGISGGQGISRGYGQRVIDSFRDDQARVAGQAAAQQTIADDAFANQGLQMQARMQNDNTSLQNKMLANQLQQSRWDNRFGNVTTAWGALAGLLR